MLSFLLQIVPFWRPLQSYDRSAHSPALRKFGFLWSISILPLIFSAIVRPAPTETAWFSFFLAGMCTEFAGTHQFIYAVSFITPIFYLLWERHEEAISYIQSGKRSVKNLKRMPPGFGWLLFWSALVFVFTSLAFAIANANPNLANPSLIQRLSASSAVFVYLYGLLCWYFSILEASGFPSNSFTEEIRDGEREQTNALQQRLAKRRGEQS